MLKVWFHLSVFFERASKSTVTLSVLSLKAWADPEGGTGGPDSVLSWLHLSVFFERASKSTVTLSALSLNTASLASRAHAVSYLTSSAVLVSVPSIVSSCNIYKKYSKTGVKQPLTNRQRP